MAAAFHLKGDGWYVTDFRDKGKSKDKGKSDAAETSSDSKSDSKTTDSKSTESKSTDSKGGSGSTTAGGLGEFVTGRLNGCRATHRCSDQSVFPSAVF